MSGCAAARKRVAVFSAKTQTPSTLSNAASTAARSPSGFTGRASPFNRRTEASPLTATTFVLTLGRRERFAHSRDVGSFLGLRPRQKQSGERDPKLGISKSGDKYLRKLLVQCAHHILGHFGKDSSLRQWGLSKSDGSPGKKRAVIAVARKLAVLLHRMWVTGQIFKPFPKMV